MASKTLRNIAENIKTSGMFSLMANETADIANTEQLVICLRWVDKNLENHEKSIGLHPLSSANAEKIFLMLLVILLRLGLSPFEWKEQC